MSDLMDDFLKRQNVGSKLIYDALARYQEVMGKNCFTENPKTDLQEAMQALEKWYTKEESHNPSLKSDKLPSCEISAKWLAGKLPCYSGYIIFFLLFYFFL